MEDPSRSGERPGSRERPLEQLVRVAFLQSWFPVLSGVSRMSASVGTSLEVEGTEKGSLWFIGMNETKIVEAAVEL